MADSLSDDSCNVVILPSVKIEPLLDEDELSFETTLESPPCDAQTRFGDSSEEEIQRLLEDKNTVNTKKATKTAVNIFREYLREKGLETCFEDFEKNDLNNVLKKFYVEARKRDGDFYKKSALSSIRFALSRHLQATRNIDIINDSEFRVSAEVFRAQAVELVRRGKGAIDHFPDITPEDLKMLYFSDVLNVNSPEGLLRKVFFDLMYLSGSKRSRGTLREQTKDTYGIAEDSQKNLRFICLKKGSKSFSGYPWKIYEKKGNLRCPVANFATYLSKLNPLSSSLWQRPKKNVLIEDEVWYENSPLGHNTLGKMMDTMSREARLSQTYSNYCLKGTHASLLDDPTLQNTMLLIRTKLVSENGHVLPKIVPKPGSSLSAIPCISLTQPVSTMQTVATSNQSVQEGSSFASNNNNLVLSTYDQKQSSPLNTPLRSSIGANATPNSVQVILPVTTPAQSQIVGPPIVVSTYQHKPGTIYSLSSAPQRKMPGSPLTTHVLDTSSGNPARQLPVKVFYNEEVQNSSSWKVIASGATNGDGRVPNLITQENFKPGHYKIRFDTETYYKSLAIEEYFYPYVEIVFIIKNPSQHYHVPLLLSPFGYSTYRGS